MATFLRRKLAGLMKKDETPPSLTVSRPEGAISFSKKELQRYSMLFTMVDHDADDAVGGAEGAFFLRRSGLSNEQLREVWRLASGGTSKPKLSKDDWLVACKLVAVTQYKGVEPSIAHIAGAAAASEALPLADFHYDTSAEIDTEKLPDIEPTAIGVRVTNPTSFGSGLSKHTKYNVITSTTLTQHFPLREMAVWRRFSDFEWLHQRLSITYPAAIIPLFPEKRMLGNADDTFVAARQAALEAYLNKVAHHPALVNSLDLLVFLNASDGGLEAARSYIEAIAAEEAESFLAKTADALGSLGAREGEKLTLKADEAFIAACATHGAALARLAHVVRAGQVLSSVQHDHAEKTGALGRASISLAAHERKHASAGTSAAAAVAAAAASSKRAEQALFAGTAGALGTVTTGSDSAAAAAFASHSAAANVDSSSIESMFKADFHDPYSALHAVTPTATTAAKPAVTPTYTGGYAEYLPDLLTVFGNELVSGSARQHEQLGHLDDVLLKHLRAERDKEAELGEAIKRREAVIEKVHEAHGTLQRRKKALASLKSTAADYHEKAHEASAAVEKAEKALTARKEELDRMTDVLKQEMARTNKARRQTAVARLAEYAKMQAAQAKQRADGWAALIPAISNDAAAVDASRESVAAIARKAEAKARAAAAARKTTGGGGAAGGAGASSSSSSSDSGAAAATAAGGMGVGVSDAAGMPVFADEAPIPSAAEL